MKDGGGGERKGGGGGGRGETETEKGGREGEVRRGRTNRDTQTQRHPMVCFEAILRTISKPQIMKLNHFYSNPTILPTPTPHNNLFLMHPAPFLRRKNNKQQ